MKNRFVTSMCLALLTSFFAIHTPLGYAQTPAPTSVAPTPNPDDVKSVDAIIAALYDVISGPANKKRDWDRMRSLFAEGGRLIPIVKRLSGDFVLRVLTVEDYIASSGKRLEESGFFEKELARRAERYGNLVHVFSTYEAKRDLKDDKPLARGINSIQLMYDGSRWFIVTVFWETERPENPLPDDYLKSRP